LEIAAHARSLMDLKSGVLLPKQTKKPQKREETLDAGKRCLSQDYKLCRLFSKTVLKLICLLCYYVLNPFFCRTWLGLILVLVDLLFCGKVEM